MGEQHGAAGPTGALIAARQLSVGYGGLPVCPPISFTLHAGDVLAVVGANGTGKSTLLRTVVGLLEPMGGELLVLGEDADPRDQAFRVAVASDLGDDAFFPALTAAEHLLLTAYGHGLARPQEVTAGLLAEFGLEDRADALPAALSSGQRRRLLLAAALARPRELLVLDEPEQRLDAGMRNRLSERLAAERQAGGAVLLATHDPAVVATAATAALVLTESSVTLTDPATAAEAIESL